MSTQDKQPTNNQDAQKSALNKRLDALGWGLFLIMGEPRFQRAADQAKRP